MPDITKRLFSLRYLKLLPDKDEMVDNTLVYLLSRSLHQSKATKTDVKRLYAIHASLVNQNLQNSATDNLRQLLLRAARSRLYLKCSEGIKFVAFLVRSFDLSMLLIAILFTDRDQ